MSRPVVSIAIPTFERPAYLRTALASVVAQTYDNLEIVILDNASSYDPAVELSEFLADRRVTFYRNDCNIGQTPNFIGSVMKTTGKYVAILGDDDIWTPDFIERLVTPMIANPEIIVSFCDHEIISGDGAVDVAKTEEYTSFFARNVLSEGVHRPFEDIALIYRSICVISGSVIRKDAIDWAAVPLTLPSFSDIYIAYLLAVTGKACYFTPKRMMKYRHHAGTMTSSDHSARRAADRWTLEFWATFMRDARLKERAYYKMMCARKVAHIMIGRLRKGNVDGLWGDLAKFTGMGIIDPRVPFYHLMYQYQFRRKGIRRTP